MNGRIILQNVLLLGINKNADLPSASTDANGNTSTSTKAASDSMATATVALKPAEALKLAVASQEGTLYLDLRPFKPRDMYTFDTDYTGVPQGTGGSQNQPAPPASSAPAPSYSYSAPAAQSAPPSAPSAGSAGGSVPVLGHTIEVIRGVTATREGVK